MAATLTKAVLVDMMGEQTGYLPRDSRELLDMILEIISGELARGSEVKISGFGRWVVHKKKSRLTVNPSTLAVIEVPAHAVVLFRPTDKFRSRLDARAFP